MAAACLQSHDEIRCLLEQTEEHLTSLNKRIETMEGKQQQQHKKIRAALKDKEKETEAIKERINEMNGKHQKNRLGKIEKKQHDQNPQLRSALDQEENYLSLVKESFKQITNLQQQKHTSIRSELLEEEERLRSSNVNSSTDLQTMMRPVRWVFSCFPTNSNVTGNQNPSNEIEDDQEDQHHKTRSALEHEKKNLDSLETSIKEIEEIQRKEEHQLTSALQPNEKQSQLQREDTETADMVLLQKSSY
ncbi:uncharacterized protein LOC122840361 [Gambusia affinis]|uniref:uncharacterized protein LOC122840361 n=1 Tax=Gambusia affinis TaxID=33528 RepID=UPI001CDB78E4|nr:uncharacterized protein LOC122840361 [Gambusia affinis]